MLTQKLYTTHPSFSCRRTLSYFKNHSIAPKTTAFRETPSKTIKFLDLSAKQGDLMNNGRDIEITPTDSNFFFFKIQKVNVKTPQNFTLTGKFNEGQKFYLESGI